MIGARKDLHVRTAALAGASDDVGEAIGIDISGTDENAAGEVGSVREEAAEQGEIESAEDLDMRSAAGASAGDDIGVAIVIDIAAGNVDAASKRRIVG